MPVAIYSVEYKNQEDGTADIVYKSRVCGGIEARQGEKVVKAKDKAGKSKKLRGKIYWEAEGRNIVDHDGFYEAVMHQLISDPKFVDEAISKVKLDEYR